jgi:hypothetical protein
MSPDFNYYQSIFLPVCHRLLDIKLDATECVSFVSDVDDSIPLTTEYFSSAARALLPFMQTDEGIVAARILMESSSSNQVELFFNALTLQLSTRPRRISGSISLNTNGHSECALVDLHGTYLASFTFKCHSDHSNAQAHRHQLPHSSASIHKVCVDVQLGTSKPSTHVIFSGLSNLPSSLNFSLFLENQVIILIVEAVPICFVDASIDMLRFSKFLCSVPSSCKVHHDHSYLNAAQVPDWLRLFLKTRVQQVSQECSPVAGSLLSAVLKNLERVSVFAEKILPANCGEDWSSVLQRTMLSELVRIVLCAWTSFWCISSPLLFDYALILTVTRYLDYFLGFMYFLCSDQLKGRVGVA